jgi:PAS domain S-box-containing protein
MLTSNSAPHVQFDKPIQRSNKADQAYINTDDEGKILECDPVCESLFGYKQSELLGHHISCLLPELQNLALVCDNEINSRLKYLSRCAFPFMVAQRNGNNFASHLFINLTNGKDGGLRIIVRKL